MRLAFADRVVVRGEKMSSDASKQVIENSENELSEADLARVEKYLSSPIHQIERKPFKPWLMMLGLVAVVVSLSLLSILIGHFVIVE